MPLPTAVPLSEVEALLAQDGEPRMVLANNHTLLCAGTVVLPERCTTLVIAQDAAPCGRRGRPAPEMH